MCPYALTAGGVRALGGKVGKSHLMFSPTEGARSGFLQLGRCTSRKEVPL